MPSRYQGSQAEIRALSALINLVRASSSVIAALHGPIDAVGLTVGQFGVLEALFHIGPMRQNELARKVLSSAGNLSVVLDNLQRRKLVRREADLDDGRCTRVALTEKGRRLIRELLPGHVQRVEQLMTALTPDEQERLRELCRRVGRNVS